MYVPFQDATFLPIAFNGGTYTFDAITLPRVDAIAARGKDGKVWLALTNVDPNNPAEITASVPGIVASSAVGQVLTAARVDAVNTFAAHRTVEPKPLCVTAEGGNLVLRLPPHSLTVVQLVQ